jgi:hypothetical protein
MARELGISDVTSRNWLRGVTVIRHDSVMAIIDRTLDSVMNDVMARLDRWRKTARREPTPEVITRAQIDQYLAAEGYL